MSPIVSVIVPNYNHAKFLTDRLESIFNQTYQNFEVILLDDRSSDTSGALLASYASHPKVSHFIVNEKNSGSTFIQWKKGINLAVGKYVWIAESDDVADVNFLQILVTALESSADLGIAYCQSYIINEKGKTLHSNKQWTDDLSIERWQNTFQAKGNIAICDFLIYKNVIPNASAVLFRKVVFETLTEPFEKFKYVGDWLVWAQILLTSDLYFTPLHLNYFRLHSHVTRVRRSPEDLSQYFAEVYAVINFMRQQLPLDHEKLEIVFNRLAQKIHRKLTLGFFLTWKGFKLSQRIYSFDPQFPKRMFILLLKRLKKGKIVCR